MKKNKMFRLASALLILVLLTTSIVGSTFAKYTTTGSATDTARVAKWGVAINTSGSLYSNAYAIKSADTGTSNLPAAWTDRLDATKITVASNTEDDNIVAPGTKSADGGLSFSISGTPEVAVEVETEFSAEDIYLAAGNYGVLVKANVTSKESLDKLIKDKGNVYSETSAVYTKITSADTYATGGNYYYLTDEVTLGDAYFPVKYGLGETTPATNDKKAIEVAKTLAEEVQSNPTATGTSDYTATYTAKHTYPANTDLGTSGPTFSKQNLSWEWEFENADTDTKTKNNAADTILGNLIAARGNTVDYVVVSVANDKAVTALSTGAGDDFTVKNGGNVVANLRTKVDITLTVTQVD